MISKSKLLKLKQKVTPEIKKKVADEKEKTVGLIVQILNGEAPDHHEILPRLIELVKIDTEEKRKRAREIESEIDQLG